MHNRIVALKAVCITGTTSHIIKGHNPLRVVDVDPHVQMRTVQNARGTEYENNMQQSTQHNKHI